MPVSSELIRRQTPKCLAGHVGQAPKDRRGDYLTKEARSWRVTHAPYNNLVPKTCPQEGRLQRTQKIAIRGRLEAVGRLGQAPASGSASSERLPEMLEIVVLEIVGTGPEIVWAPAELTKWKMCNVPAKA
jgi:hypothetical protein